MLIACVFWATAYAINKEAIETMPPFTVMMYRFALASMAMLVIYRNKLKAVSLRDVKVGSFIGVFMFLGMLSAIIGIKYTTASKQSFILNSSVLFVPFLA